MKVLIRYWLIHYLFLLLLYIVYKISFCLIYIPFNAADIVSVLYHGFILDLASAAHSSFLPALLLALAYVTGLRFLKNALFCYAIILILLNNLLFIADLELYRHWGYRMDASVIQYIITPSEAMASVSLGRVIILISSVLILTVSLALIYHRWLIKPIQSNIRIKWTAIPVFLFAGALLLIPARGGFSVQPINIGNVYFSSRPVLNHAAENIFWKMGFTLTGRNPSDNNYVFFPQTNNNPLPIKVINTENILTCERPNVIIIVMESFTAKIIEPCGGLPDITPCFNALARRGIFFSQCYSSGERTDKGLVSILSGYPSQPDNAIMKYPEKTQNLPQLAKDMAKHGYFTAFYYGGDLNFASMNSYICQANYNRVVSESNFRNQTNRTKWGVHDHVLFDYVLKDIDSLTSPFFAVCLTLSNHEPFSVPVNKFSNRKNETEEFLNSAAYADMCLGHFMAGCARKPWFNNTLFILVSDHGHLLPGPCAAYDKERFHIPLLLFGNVLSVKDTTINDFASQTDISLTLLNQLGIASADYSFSDDLFDRNRIPKAFYLYNNGFGLLKDSSHVIFDNSSQKVIKQKGDTGGHIMDDAKWLMQWTYEDFLRKEFNN